MTIGLDNCYIVSNKQSKTTNEILYFKKDHRQVVIESWWRSSAWFVTPKNQDEIDALTYAERGGDLDISSFEEHEFGMMDEEYSCSLQFYGVDDIELEDEIEQGWFEDGHEYFELNDWHDYGTEFYINGGVLIEETNGVFYET